MSIGSFTVFRELAVKPIFSAGTSSKVLFFLSLSQGRPLSRIYRVTVKTFLKGLLTVSFFFFPFFFKNLPSYLTVSFPPFRILGIDLRQFRVSRKRISVNLFLVLSLLLSYVLLHFFFFDITYLKIPLHARRSIHVLEKKRKESFRITSSYLVCINAFTRFPGGCVAVRPCAR